MTKDDSEVVLVVVISDIL